MKYAFACGWSQESNDHTHITQAYPGEVKARSRESVTNVDHNGPTKVVAACLVEGVEVREVGEHLCSGSVQQLLVPAEKGNTQLPLSTSPCQTVFLFIVGVKSKFEEKSRSMQQVWKMAYTNEVGCMEHTFVALLLILFV